MLLVEIDDEGCFMHRGMEWMPLTDDGDAFRLAVRLKLHINIFAASDEEGISTPGFVEVWAPGHSDDPLRTEYVEAGDYLAAARRAIVRASAELGRTLQ